MTTTPEDRAYISQVASTIRDQIGLGVLMALGAHGLRYTTHKTRPALAMNVKLLPFNADGTRSRQPRIMHLVVALNGNDYYDIVVTYLNRKREQVVHETATDVDVSSLRSVLLGFDSERERETATQSK